MSANLEADDENGAENGAALAAARLSSQNCASVALCIVEAHAMLARYQTHRLAVFLASLVALFAAAGVRAQATDELSGLRGEVSRLYGQSKYAEAMPIAERYVAVARQKHGEEHTEFATAVSWLALLYEAQGRYGEAEPLYQRSLAIREKALGPDHPDVGSSLNNLANVYRKRGRYPEAEPLYNRALAITEKALGPDHPDVGESLNNLANVYWAQGRYAEAEPLYRRTVSILEKALGPDHPDVGIALSGLANVYWAQGRYAEAEPLSKRSLAIAEKALGPDHPDVGIALNNLANVYWAQGRYAEAEPLHRRSLTIREKALGPDHPDVGELLNNLASVYRELGRYAEAEPLYTRTVSIFEKALGPDHPNVGIALSGLAELYRAQGRYAEAEPLSKRALAIAEKALGPDHPDVGARLNNLANVYRELGRYAEAEPLYTRTVSIWEKALGPDHPNVGTALNNLAELYDTQGRYAEAEPLYKRALAITEKALGPDHPDVGTRLNNLAGLYRAQGRYAEAQPLYRRTVSIYEKALGPDHPNVGTALNNLAALHFMQRDWARAADLWRRSTAVTVRRAERGTDDVGQALTGKRKGEAEQNSYRFWRLIKVVHRLAAQDRGTDANLLREMFQTAQWAKASEAAASLAQMAARSAKGDPVLGALIRLRQDLVGEWQKRDAVRTAAVSLAPDKRDRAAEAANVARLVAIDTRIAEIDQRVKADFPDYAAFSRPQPLSIEEVQGELRADEALVLFLDTSEWTPTPEETFIWVVTKTDVRWVRSELGTNALGEHVAALRCGLDATAWHGEAGDRCIKLLKIGAGQMPMGDDPLPLDLNRAHALYQALFGEVEDLIRGKHLLIVPSGPLTQLPFHVLVRTFEGVDQPRWKTREVARLGVGFADLSEETRRLVGKPGVLIANVIAGGPAQRAGLQVNDVVFSIAEEHVGDASGGVLAVRRHTPGSSVVLVLARHGLELTVSVTLDSMSVNEWQPSYLNASADRSVRWIARDQPITVLPAVSSLKALRRVARPSAASKPMLGVGNPLLNGNPAEVPQHARWGALARSKQVCSGLQPLQVADATRKARGVLRVATRGNRADLDHLRAQVPLHDTADELCAVAADLKLAPDDIRLGERATEEALKQLSVEGRLAQYRVIHFATHGTIAGEIEGTSEPGLILTPPKEQSDLDDGYLSASEVAGLKLDADWVILSACNTAAGNAQGAEALSGLARAFIYAGARALLVSHWAVDSGATVKLITSAVGTISRDPGISRAEALRRAMLGMIEAGGREAHPALWAPFIVVGEGAAAR
jgi:tetratricopeptide (TPR) repeat protein